MVRCTILPAPSKKARKNITTYSPTHTTTESFTEIGQSLTANLQELRFEKESEIMANYEKLEKQLTITYNTNKSKSKYLLSDETIKLINRRKS